MRGTLRKYLLIFILFLSTTCFAQEGLVKVRIDDYTGGMVSNILSDLLEPNQAASMVNVALERRGSVSKRKGQALFNLDVGSTAFRGVGRFDPDATTSYIIAASGVDVIRSKINDTSWTVINSSSSLTTGKNTEFVQANDLLFVLNGFDNPIWSDGPNLYTAGDYPTSPPTATTGAWLRNYLFLAGATTENDWVYISNNLEPQLFDAGDIIKINTGDGQKIQKLLAYRLNELIIYKERSTFVLDITGATPLTDWTVQPISKVVGTIAPRSVVSLGNDQWFLSSEPIAIRSLVRSSFDKILVDMVSRPIQDIFDRKNSSGFNINTAVIDKSCAVLFNNKYILAVPVGTSTVNNLVIVHDFLWNAWYLIKGWFPSDWVEFNNRRFYIDANDGRVLEVFTGTTGDFAEGPNFINSASIPSAGIEWVIQTKALDFDNPENYKQLDALEVEFDPTGDYDANLFINTDNEGWESIGTVNLAGQSLTLPVDLPTTLQNAGIARETFQTQQYGEFKKMGIMVTNTASEETVTLERITNFGRIKQWRRE